MDSTSRTVSQFALPASTWLDEALFAHFDRMPSAAAGDYVAEFANEYGERMTFVQPAGHATGVLFHSDLDYVPVLPDRYGRCAGVVLSRSEELWVQACAERAFSAAGRPGGALDDEREMGVLFAASLIDAGLVPADHQARIAVGVYLAGIEVERLGLAGTASVRELGLSSEPKFLEGVIAGLGVTGR